MCIIFSIAACHSSGNNDAELSPFTSDGCSLFPDSSIITKKDWCKCCFQHDLAYWQGGTERQREHADLVLKQCVLQRTGDAALAKIIYDGVRFGGSPYFYNWYRWGYGWTYERKYQVLVDSELEQVKRLIEQYLASGDKDYCDSR
jgi:hypothetical protein